MKDIEERSPRGVVFGSWKIWWKTSRPFTLIASACPVMVGTTLAAYEGVFHANTLFITFIWYLFYQIGTNYFNEYYDYLYHLDHHQSLGAMKVIFRNEMTPHQVLWGGIISYGIAILFSLVLIYQFGLLILLVGIIWMLIGYFYSAKPLQLACLGLGDVAVYLVMGFSMTCISYYVQIPHWSWRAFVASVAVGLLATAMLNMNNVRDYADDLAVNKRTLPVRFGLKFGQRFHIVLLIGSYAVITFFSLVGFFPLSSIAVWLTFPWAFRNMRAVLGTTERKVFIASMKQTALLHFLFSMILALSIIIAIWLR